jgi:AraC-like DNA-binding protein
MDALSEALNAVRMTGAIFANAICTAPWGFAVPAIDALERVVQMLARGTERVVGYHLVTEGTALIRIPGRDDVSLAAGDIVIIPHGEAHTISNGTPPALSQPDTLGRWLAGDLSPLRIDGGGETSRFVCGYFGCERHAARLFLAGLPSIITINVRNEPAVAWLESTMRLLLDEATSGRPGRAALLAKMAEAIFIATLRRYMELLPPEARGWLAGARDPIVGHALALLHRQPDSPWTVAKLAGAVGSSPSLVAHRFTQYLGEPPLTYLARWRLQLAARLLQTTHKTILNVALDVGYESEAAFNRAFKREFGLPPAQYRHRLAGNGAGPPVRESPDVASRTVPRWSRLAR